MKNRVHLDLHAGGLGARRRRAPEAVDARRPRRHPALGRPAGAADLGHACADPEGNEFCVQTLEAPSSVSAPDHWSRRRPICRPKRGSAAGAALAEEALDVDDDAHHLADGDQAAVVGGRDVNVSRRPSTFESIASAITVAPTGDGCRWSRRTFIPTVVVPSASDGAIARQHASSHRASSRGVPSTSTVPGAQGPRRVAHRRPPSSPRPAVPSPPSRAAR